MRTMIITGVVCLFVAGSLTAGDSAADRMFDRLLGLAGEWEGTYEWSGGRTGSGNLKVTYFVTGNGSAVMETLIQNGTPTMTTVYHIDGADLRMTHYCAARNQPRLKATRVDEPAGAVDFSFVDLTSESGAGAAHVEALALRIVDSDHLNLTFTFRGGPGKGGQENITLSRVR
jgi:hypothetical protein